MRKIEYHANETDDGMMLKNFLKKQGFSHAVITRLKQNDGLFLNGGHIRTIDPVHSGDIITVYLKDAADIAPNAFLNATVIYEDEDILAFDKPPFMPVHRSKGHDDDTLENLFAALHPGLTFRAVSRLDKNTSGLVIAAKNKLAASKLMSDPKYRPTKLYYAVAEGDVSSLLGGSGEIVAPIAREKEDEIKRVVREDGAFAHTKFRVISSSAVSSLLEVTLLTGRTHQIRVHLSYIGHPLIGDTLYGGSTELIRRQALHCGKITVRHPVTDDIIELEAPIPEDIRAVIR